MESATRRTARRWSGVLRVAVCAVVVLLGIPANAPAASLRLHDTGLTGNIARGDGVRYVASATSDGPVTVLDTRTGERRTIPTPANCAFRDIHRGTLLWSCRTSSQLYNSGATYDLATGRVATLPQPRPSAGGLPDRATYDAIGDRWARVIFFGYHYAYPTYVERTSGQQPTVKRRRDRVVDLDAPSLTRKLCSGQRRPYVDDDASGIGTELGELAIAGRRAAATTYPSAAGGTARVELQRCATRPRTLTVCRRVICTQPVINDRIVAWAESHFDHRGRATGRLVVRSLRTGRTRTTATSPTTLEPLLVGDRLYVLAAGPANRLLGVAI
jgi:hypothetical protein